MASKNTERFRIIWTRGRLQPFAVWRGHFVWRFFERREDANAYIDGELARERALVGAGRRDVDPGTTDGRNDHA